MGLQVVSMGPRAGSSMRLGRPEHMLGSFSAGRIMGQRLRRGRALVRYLWVILALAITEMETHFGVRALSLCRNNFELTRTLVLATFTVNTKA